VSRECLKETGTGDRIANASISEIVTEGRCIRNHLIGVTGNRRANLCAYAVRAPKSIGPALAASLGVILSEIGSLYLLKKPEQSEQAKDADRCGRGDITHIVISELSFSGRPPTSRRRS